MSEKDNTYTNSEILDHIVGSTPYNFNPNQLLSGESVEEHEGVGGSRRKQGLEDGCFGNNSTSFSPLNISSRSCPIGYATKNDFEKFFHSIFGKGNGNTYKTCSENFNTKVDVSFSEFVFRIKNTGVENFFYEYMNNHGFIEGEDIPSYFEKEFKKFDLKVGYCQLIVLYKNFFDPGKDFRLNVKGKRRKRGTPSSNKRSRINGRLLNRPHVLHMLKDYKEEWQRKEEKEFQKQRNLEIKGKKKLKKRKRKKKCNLKYFLNTVTIMEIILGKIKFLFNLLDECKQKMGTKKMDFEKLEEFFQSVYIGKKVVQGSLMQTFDYFFK